MKTCRCGNEFTQYTTIQNCCIPCMIKKVNRQKAAKAKQQKKAGRLKTREQKEALRTRSWYSKKMIKSFNAFIRYRDKDDPCISCGRHHEGVYHSGHFLTTKARPWLCVHPANASKQCYSCNVPLSGNISSYRLKLQEKFGSEMLTYLENSLSDYVFTIDDMKEIDKHYREELKYLKGQQK